MPKGRPSLRQVLAKMIDEVVVMHKEFGGLPSSLEANEIWKDIWLEETHHSTAIEGNTLTSKEVYNLVEQDMVTGHKEMRHYLEVQGYSRAARWVYEEAFDANKRLDVKISMQHISQIHKLLMELVWNAYPPVTGDKPGLIRTGPTPTIRGSSLKLPPSGDVPKLLQDLVDKINSGPIVGKDYMVEWVAKIHAEFEAIHPFRDGNGRTGRLLMNYLLIAYGHPPAIIFKSQRPKYIRSLEKAQGKNPDYTMLVELVARSVRDNLNKLMLPKLSKDINLVPLSALAEGTAYKPNYLRRLAQEGKLKAVKEGSLWLSSKKWLQDYIDSRSSRGRR
jgi:Fic family protein